MDAQRKPDLSRPPSSDEGSRTPAQCMLMAQSATDPMVVRDWLVRAVEIGEALFAEAASEEPPGAVDWQVVTRPYVVAAYRLAAIEWSQGNQSKALDLYRNAMKAEPSDSLGVRYFLAARLLDSGQFDEFTGVVEKFDGDGSTYWKFNRALSWFWRSGESSMAQAALDRAIQSNRYALALLAGLEPIGELTPRVPDAGSVQEAMHLAHWYASGWRNVNGAVDWLARVVSRGDAKDNEST